MLKDVTGVPIIPGNDGKDCPGNGSNPDIECCCGECDYMLRCLDPQFPAQCRTCADLECPRKVTQNRMAVYDPADRILSFRESPTTFVGVKVALFHSPLENILPQALLLLSPQRPFVFVGPQCPPDT